MCGRYATARSRQELLDAFGVQVDETWGGDGEDLLRADYNAAPTKSLPAILDRADPTAEEAVPVRRLKMLRWGLVPSWAKDPAIGNRMINARVETVAEKPSFRRAFAKRRCLLPADGYYEWYTSKDEKTGKTKKQPFFIAPKNHDILSLAGLYELWKPEDGDWLWTFTILTTQAVDAVGHIHDRMPMTVTDEDAWLDPATQDPGSLRVPAMSGELEAVPVSKAVGNVRNNGPSLIEPLKAEGGEETLF
ncbi:SOS response-associated peptidase [Actinocorallia populi]|uniref:SOS response-associated peptidase n=1 Tax=Actinocorallia populi TaxID=2079200 RepID=UPI000D0928CC|nr:SOS response-associated peptidase [Actinocorallia populi]